MSAARGTAAAVLAGGRGTRLGGADKQALFLGADGDGGEPLGRRAVRLLSERFDELIVVTSRPELYAGTRASCVPDVYPGRGPVSGIHAALDASGRDWVYVMGCDMPFFSPAWADRLIAEAEAALGRGEAPLAAYALYGRHMEPLHALYSRRLLPALELALRGEGDPSVKSALSGLSRVEIPEAEARRYSPDWSLFSNINTAEDLARAAGLAGSGGLRPGTPP